MCRFEIRVEQVWKDIVKAFPKGLYEHKTAENNMVGLLGYQVKRILLSERGVYPIHTRTKLKASFDPLPKYFA